MITAQNLKRFNVEGGTIAGTLEEEMEAINQLNAAYTLDAADREEEEELKDEVASTLHKAVS